MAKFNTVVGVLCLPVNRRGQVLITRRHSPGRLFWHNKWQIAGGGMELGETPEQTLARETQEELGVSARIIFPFPIIKTIAYSKKDYADPVTQPIHLVLICYLVDIGDQKVDVSQDEETSSYRWIYPHQIHHLKYLPLTKEFVEAADQIIKDFHLLK